MTLVHANNAQVDTSRARELRFGLLEPVRINDTRK